MQPPPSQPHRTADYPPPSTSSSQQHPRLTALAPTLSSLSSTSSSSSSSSLSPSLSTVGAELTPYHEGWKVHIANLSSHSPVVQRDALTALHAISQQSSLHAFHLIALQILPHLLVLCSARLPDQSIAALALSTLANLSYEQWQQPKQQDYLFQHLYQPILSALCGPSGEEREERVRIQAYRCMWCLMQRNEKAKQDEKVMRDPILLPTIARDISGPSEAIRQMCGGMMWAMAEKSAQLPHSLFTQQFVQIKGVDYVLLALDPSRPNSADSLYIVLSALNVLCTDTTAKKRIAQKNGISMLLKLMIEHPAAMSSSLVIGRLSDVVSTLTFNQPIEREQATRMGAVKQFSRYLVLACPRGPQRPGGGRGLTPAMPRLCIAMIALCYRHSAMENEAGRAALMEDVEPAFDALLSQLTNPVLPAGPSSAIAPALTLSLLAYNNSRLLQKLLDGHALSHILHFLTPGHAASEEERRRLQHTGLFMLLHLLASSYQPMQEECMRLKVMHTVIPLLQRRSLLALSLRVLTVLCYRSPDASTAINRLSDGGVRRQIWNLFKDAGQRRDTQLCCLTAGCLYAIMAKESLRSEEGVKKLVGDVNNSGEAQHAIKLLQTAFANVARQQQQQQQQQQNSSRAGQPPAGGGGGSENVTAGQHHSQQSSLQQPMRRDERDAMLGPVGASGGAGGGLSDETFGAAVMRNAAPSSDDAMGFLDELVEMEEQGLLHG